MPLGTWGLGRGKRRDFTATHGGPVLSPGNGDAEDPRAAGGQLGGVLWGGCTQEHLLTNGPCPHPAEPSCARHVSRPVCLADTRVPVGVSEQPSGSWNSPRSLGSGQETPVTVGLLGLHWSEVITQQ